MGRDDDSSKTMLYIAIGALATIGAGYLTWRYLLSDETKDKAKHMARKAVMRANDAASEAIDVGRDAAKGMMQRAR